MSDYFILCHLSNITSIPPLLSSSFTLAVLVLNQPPFILAQHSMNSVVSFDFAERFVIKNRHFSCSSIWYPIIIYCSSRRMESEWILLRVDNLSLVLHVVVNIRSDLFTMSFSPFPLLHRSSVLSIATSPALSFVPFPSHPSQLQPGEAMVLAATQIMPLSTITQ